MFEGEKVRLRSVELSDLDDIMKYWNNLKLRRFLNTVLPISRGEEEEWIRSTWKSKKEGKEFIFTIEKLDTNKFLGMSGLHNVDWINRSAELGIAIHAEENWNKGYGTDAMKVLLKFGFDYLNLHRIELNVFVFNKRALRVYEKVGFKQIGRRRKSLFREAQYHDEILMDILRDEWVEMHKKKEE